MYKKYKTEESRYDPAGPNPPGLQKTLIAQVAPNLLLSGVGEGGYYKLIRNQEYYHFKFLIVFYYFD